MYFSSLSSFRNKRKPKNIKSSFHFFCFSSFIHHQPEDKRFFFFLVVGEQSCTSLLGVLQVLVKEEWKTTQNQDRNLEINIWTDERKYKLPKFNYFSKLQSLSENIFLKRFFGCNLWGLSKRSKKTKKKKQAPLF